MKPFNKKFSKWFSIKSFPQQSKLIKYLLKVMNLCAKLLLFLTILIGGLYMHLTLIHKFDPIDIIEVQPNRQFSMPKIPERDQDPFLHPSTKYLLTQQMMTPEDFDVDEETGDIYTGLFDGRIAVIRNQDVSTFQVLGKSEGQVLGFGFSRDKSSLIFMASGVGLQRMDLKTRKISTIIDEIDGVKLNTMASNSYAETRNGQFYFTVSTDKYVMNDFTKDVLRLHSNGKLYHFNPISKKVELIIDGLYFANGIVLEEGQQSVLVAETTMYRVTRIWVKGAKKGQSETLIDNLPAYADNLYSTKPHELWVALLGWRNFFTGILNSTKFIRNLIIFFKLDHHLAELMDMQYSGGVKIDTRTGKVIEWVVGRAEHLKFSTTIKERRGKLYVGSLSTPAIAIIDPMQLKKAKKGNSSTGDL